MQYLEEYEQFDKMKDEYAETDEKPYDFDLNIEIPDDGEDFQMHTPTGKEIKDEDDLLL